MPPMGKATGFLEYGRSDRSYRPVAERVGHWQEFVEPLGDEGTRRQAARCMDCGIPYFYIPLDNSFPPKS